MHGMEEKEEILDDGPEGRDEDINEDDIEVIACDQEGKALDSEAGEEDDSFCDDEMQKELKESREDYLRLYAEFDNYKKRMAKDKEELSKFANESIVLDLIPSIDNMEIALKHARDNEDPDAPKDGLVQGVDMTLRELLRTLERYGLSLIEAEGKPFDPEFHHAVSQVETEEMDAGMVVDVLRRGYVFNGKVVRATMVSVSKKPGEGTGEE